jgi:hypothetical protein
MAWSPARRSNAGRFEVEDPGDYAAFNSYQPGYGTRSRLLLQSRVAAVAKRPAMKTGELRWAFEPAGSKSMPAPPR